MNTTIIHKYETVTVEEVNGTDGKIVYVYLNRPKQRNACSTQLLDDMAKAYTTLSYNYKVRVIILAGRGKSFCAGADFSAPPNKGLGTKLDTFREVRHATKSWDRAGAALRNSDAITIAKVHGHASGGGLGIAFINDLVIMEESTRCWLPEVELGTPMIGGLTPIFASIVGPKRAMEMILMGEDVPPVELKQMGLVNRVVKGEKSLDDVTHHFATTIAKQYEPALHSVKLMFKGIYHREQMGNITNFDGDTSLIGGLWDKASGRQNSGLIRDNTDGRSKM